MHRGNLPGYDCVWELDHCMFPSSKLKQSVSACIGTRVSTCFVSEFSCNHSRNVSVDLSADVGSFDLDLKV